MTNYRLEKNDFEKFYELYLYSFNRPDNEQKKNALSDRFDHSLAYGIMNGDKLGSGLLSIPFTVNFHGVTYHMNGIGDVMSAPEFAGRGGAGTLLNQALTDMYNENVTLSYLAPFSFKYYRKFGYEQVFNHVITDIPSSKWPRIKSPNSGHIKRVRLNEVPKSARILYNNHNILGGVIREDWWWDHMAYKHSDWFAALYYNDTDELDGYLFYSNENDNLIIQEWVTNDPNSYKALANFIVKHQSMFNNFIYESPDSEVKTDLLDEPYVAKVSTIPYMSARIVNLKSFIKKYPFIKHNLDPVIIDVSDTLEWNNQTWSLSIKNGNVKFEKTSEPSSVKLDIQTLTKAMFGIRSLNSLAHYGYVQGSTVSIDTLSKILVTEKPQLRDYF
ncbi:GNAT family N-acetyltransferase [Companilactobacillus allii]|uniref:GNAT family N-acetyltransferase n=1 Tax=Companilactobacillus allii TaxID=1847728 RepID=A0A1P8Q549_9LACO|nr:GNAT family N-acetyltransferase [Companilactobacillus allii]APX72982.1 GNAT family N-acetyltransferase [Companilactobacillus allii]USQ67777.1 GNAT family N-acetyltransferase [Companilactobacillus allii]